MYRLAAVTAEGVTWTLRRNCSVTPRQLGLLMGALAVPSLMVAGFFGSRGVWMVVLFSVLELTAVAVAFLAYARHAADGELICVSRGRLVVEQEEAGLLRRAEFSGHTVRIDVPFASEQLVLVRSGERSMAVGRFVRADLRPLLASELRLALGDL